MSNELNTKSSASPSPFAITTTQPLLTSSNVSVIAIPSNMPPGMIINNSCNDIYDECVSSNNCICGRAFNDSRIPVAINVDWRYPGTAFQIANITGNSLFLSNGRLIGLDLETKRVNIDEPVDIEWI
jgi:hypothetical protein